MAAYDREQVESAFIRALDLQRRVDALGHRFPADSEVCAHLDAASASLDEAMVEMSAIIDACE